MTNKLNLGYHERLDEKLSNMVYRGYEKGAKILQFFTRPPQSFILTKHSSSELEELKTASYNFGIKTVIHGSFLINLCKDTNDRILKNSLELISEDMKESVKCGSIGVVIHMGHNTSKISNSKAFDNYVKHVKMILQKTPTNSTLILETGAGQGHEIATNFNELCKIRSSLTKEEQLRVKYCIDTCHIFSSGYNLSEKDFIGTLSQYIDITLGWDNVILIHLNDSKCEVNTRKDRHADIGTGKINFEGLVEFVRICKEKNIPMVLETPCDSLSLSEQIFLLNESI